MIPPAGSDAAPRVVLVDDEAHIRLLMRAVLESLGFRVVGEAQDGEKAAALFEREKPDLILLDINMPGCGGEEFLKSLGSRVEDACVIMLSSIADAATVERLLALGAWQYIRKDASIPEMKELIQEAWDSFRARDGGA